jgi:hypothetical protein
MRIPSLLIDLGIVLALPVLLPLAFIRHYLDERHLRATAAGAVCPLCGAILGVEALHRADEHWRAYVAELHRNHPGVRFRLVRSVRAICGVCGSMLAFRGKPRTFTTVSGVGPQPPRHRPTTSGDNPEA